MPGTWDRQKRCPECGCLFEGLCSHPCETHGLYEQDREGQLEDRDIAQHYNSGHWISEPMP